MTISLKEAEKNTSILLDNLHETLLYLQRVMKDDEKSPNGCVCLNPHEIAFMLTKGLE